MKRSWLPIGLAVVLTVAVVSWLSSHLSSTVYRPRESGSVPRPGVAQDPLVKDNRVEIAYTLPDRERERLLQAIGRYCAQDTYHADSCIHHIATCGAPCMVAVPRPMRRRILADYQRLRAERGLPPVQRLPESEND